MSSLLKSSALYALALAGLSASAMPVGVQMAMRGRAAAQSAQAAVDAAFPALSSTATATDVEAVLGTATDGAIADNITDVSAYTEFREWAKSAGAASVKASNTAWLSYAVGAPGVVPMPQDGDLVIDEVSVGTDGKLDAVFSLDGVSIGSAALESRLKTVFGVEGAKTLTDAFSDQNIGLSLEPTGDGRVKATIVPPTDVGKSFFIRMKVK